jgi:hypothetical protein
MRTLWVIALAVTFLGAAGPAQAQEPAPGRPRLEELRRRIRERVAQRIQQELNLTPDQMQRLRTTVGTYAARRRRQPRQRGAADGRADGRPGTIRGELPGRAAGAGPVPRSGSARQDHPAPRPADQSRARAPSPAAIHGSLTSIAVDSRLPPPGLVMRRRLSMPLLCLPARSSPRSRCRGPT